MERTRQATAQQSNEANEKPNELESPYKSVNRLAAKEMRERPQRMHERGDPVTILVNEDSEDADILKCFVQNAELSRQNKWQYQLVDEDGTILEDGKFYEEEDVTANPTRKPVS